jgi:hypothetical protein
MAGRNKSAADDNHRKAFNVFLDFLSARGLHGSPNDSSPLTLESISVEERSIVMRKFLRHLYDDLGKRGDTLSAFMGQLRQNWVTAGVKCTFLSFTKEDSKEIKKAAKPNKAELKTKLEKKAANQKEYIRMFMLKLLRTLLWVSGLKELDDIRFANQRGLPFASEASAIDKMVTSAAAGFHSEVGCRGEQIGLSKTESADNQLITAGDVRFRMGVGEPDLQGHFQEFTEMDGEELWKWIVMKMGEGPTDSFSSTEEGSREHLRAKKASLVNRVTQVEVMLVRTKTVGKAGILIARRSPLEETRLQDLIILLSYTQPLSTDGLFTRYARTRPGDGGVTRRNYTMADINKSAKLMAKLAGIAHASTRFSTKSFRYMFYTYIKAYELKRNPNPHAISEMGQSRGVWTGASGAKRKESNADIFYDRSDDRNYGPAVFYDHDDDEGEKTALLSKYPYIAGKAARETTSVIPQKRPVTEDHPCTYCGVGSARIPCTRLCNQVWYCCPADRLKDAATHASVCIHPIGLPTTSEEAVTLKMRLDQLQANWKLADRTQGNANPGLFVGDVMEESTSYIPSRLITATPPLDGAVHERDGDTNRPLPNPQVDPLSLHRIDGTPSLGLTIIVGESLPESPTLNMIPELRRANSSMPRRESPDRLTLGTHDPLGDLNPGLSVEKGVGEDQSTLSNLGITTPLPLDGVVHEREEDNSQVDHLSRVEGIEELPALETPQSNISSRGEILRPGIIRVDPLSAERMILRNVVAGKVNLDSISAITGGLFRFPIISEPFKMTYGQWIIFHLFFESALKEHTKGARKSLLGPCTNGYEAFTDLYRWEKSLLDAVGSSTIRLYDPILVLVRHDRGLENRIATLAKYTKKSTCPDELKPLKVLSELYNVGKDGIRSAVLRYYRIPEGNYKVRVELVATSLLEGDEVRCGIFPAIGDTYRELRLHELDYPATLVPDWGLWDLVETREMTWVHKTQVLTGMPPLIREGQVGIEITSDIGSEEGFGSETSDEEDEDYETVE